MGGLSLMVGTTWEGAAGIMDFRAAGVGPTSSNWQSAGRLTPWMWVQ